MALFDVLFPKTRLTVGVLQFDASVTETHDRSIELTSHPVEDGATITDHIILQPEEFSATGIVSNTPLFFSASLQAESPLTDDLTPINDRVDAAYDELRSIQDSGLLVTIVTSLREYESMALVNLSITRDSSSGNVLNASMSFREVLKANLLEAGEEIPVNPARIQPPALGVLPALSGIAAAIALSAAAATLPFLVEDV